MGVRLELSPHVIKLMSAEDQARYGGNVNNDDDGVRGVRVRDQPSPKRDVVERKEQGDFANWLLLQNSQGRKIPYVWHATHTPSKATPGTPDFWVGINARSIWFEFKRGPSQKLTPEQVEFRDCCVHQRIEWHLVYTAGEAIALTERAGPRPDGR